jgi:hypothetical protein
MPQLTTQHHCSRPLDVQDQASAISAAVEPYAQPCWTPGTWCFELDSLWTPRVGWIALIAIALSTGSLNAQSLRPGAARTTASVHLRTVGSSGGASKAVLAVGERVSILECLSSWCQVLYKSTSGWIASRYLEMVVTEPVRSAGADASANSWPPRPETDSISVQGPALKPSMHRYFSLAGGFNVIGKEKGVALLGAFGVSRGPLTGQLVVADITLVAGESDGRYYMDTFSNGQSRCRDSVTGQFAATSLCNAPVETRYAVAVDARYSLRGKGGFLGFGGRAGTLSTLYATAGFAGEVEKNAQLSAWVSAGRGFFQLMVAGSLYVPTVALR